MWTNAIDETAGGLCRALDGMTGHFPSACLVNAGRPALYLALAAGIALATIAIVAWRQTRQA